MDIEELKALIADGESETLELKTSTAEKHQAEVRIRLLSFAKKRSWIAQSL